MNPLSWKVNPVFRKEWQRSRWFLLGALILGTMIPALFIVLTLAYVRNSSDQDAVNTFLGGAYYISPPLIALFAVAGLFAAEVESGTIPLLLSLPISRRRIWLAKVLAALALALVAFAAFAIPGLVSIAGALEIVSLSAYIPDLLIWSFVAFSMGLLCSALAERTIAALLAAVIATLALFAGALYVTDQFGARLFGVDALFDASLWALAATPALWLASLLAFTRGQDLQSRRKWLVAVPASILIFALIALPIIGMVRYATRYDRASVDALDHPTLSASGTVLGLVAHAQPISVKRDADAWQTASSRHWGGFHPGPEDYRSNHLVILDVSTGEEILVQRGGGTAAVSPDRRLAALLLDAPAITLGREDRGPRKLEIRDLETDHLLYRGYPEAIAVLPTPPDEPYVPALSYNAAAWSPDSQWLAVYNSFGSAQQLLVMDPEGTSLQPLPTDSLLGGSWGWSPDSTVYYLDDSLRVLHHTPASKADELVCDPRDFPGFPAGVTPESGSLTVSPDGRVLAISVYAEPPAENLSRTEPPAPQVVSFVLRADGTHPQLICQSIVDTATIDIPGFLWSPDSQHLYFLDPRSRGRVLQWSAADATLTAHRLPVPLRWGYVRALPDSSGLLVWEAHRVWTLNHRGETTPLAFTFPLSMDIGRAIGFDHAGRLVVPCQGEEGESLASLDLATGGIDVIYP